MPIIKKDFIIFNDAIIGGKMFDSGTFKTNEKIAILPLRHKGDKVSKIDLK